MSIRVLPGTKRDIAETIGRYFESRAMPFHIEEHPANALHVGFRSDGHPVEVTVTFDAAAFDAFERENVERQRASLARIAAAFAEAMARRGPHAVAGDLHIDRF